jgi:hypothetical protein
MRRRLIMPGQQRHTVSPTLHRFIPVVMSMLGLLATAAWAETLPLPPSAKVRLPALYAGLDSSQRLGESAPRRTP